MDRLLPTDELNVISELVTQDFAAPPEKRKEIKDDRIDEILDMLILSYMYGIEAGHDMLGFDGELSVDRMKQSIYREIAGKTWEQRISDYYDQEGGTADEVIRVIETDANRIYNSGILDVGDEYAEQDPEGGANLTKTWMTMLDDRVRDTHDYLEGMTVPYRDRFWTFDGDSAMYPGDFTLPQNNINCRCRVVLRKRNRT